MWGSEGRPVLDLLVGEGANPANCACVFRRQLGKITTYVSIYPSIYSLKIGAWTEIKKTLIYFLSFEHD